MVEINYYLATKRQLIDTCLNDLLPKEDCEPHSIHRAIRYCVFAGGKRLRPILVLAAGSLFEGDERVLLPFACAIEMIHNYSLIHDDLPALDNDDLRRGRPTSHKVFGEAIAILAGDALLTQAFQVLASTPLASSLERKRAEVIRAVATAAGTQYGMIAGQVLDLESEGKEVDGETVDAIHNAKTGALFAVSTQCGGILSGATPEESAILSNFGKKVGLAFQIIDDILDIETSSEILGKTAGKDLHQKKATYPKIRGIEQSRQRVIELIDTAIGEVRSFGHRADLLIEIALHIGNRMPKTSSR